MIEIQVENEKDLKVFINGFPDIKEIPSEKLGNIIAVLERQIDRCYHEGLGINSHDDKLEKAKN